MGARPCHARALDAVGTVILAAWGAWCWARRIPRDATDAHDRIAARRARAR